MHAYARDPGPDHAARGIVGGMVSGSLAFAGLLGLLSLTADLSALGWTVAVASWCGLVELVRRAAQRAGRDHLGPADRVTLARAALACAVAGLTADVVVSAADPAALVALSLVAILLDGVDGRVARRTGTSSEFGARFDYEVDAFLILVLSVCVASSWGWWVLILGLARYQFVAAARVLPWLRAPLPPRPWAKVVAVVVALTLVVAASGVLPGPVTLAALVLSTALLAESFAHSVVALMRLHGLRPGIGAAVTAILAVALVWVALVAPDAPAAASPRTLVRIPVEGLLFVALVLVLPRRPARILALFCGLVLGLVTVLRALDVGFSIAFDTQFHPVYDTAYAGPALDLMSDTIGRPQALAAAMGLGVALIAVLTLLPWAALRVAALVARHRRASATTLALLTGLAVLATATGARSAPGGPLASAATVSLVSAHTGQIRSDLRDQRDFDRDIAAPDPLAAIPTPDLLTDLRGKDVLVVFVESYGVRALDLPAVQAAMARGQRRLKAAGFSPYSARVTSPTFGGGSWLAHATLQTGLWVDNQRRFDQLEGLQRSTLTDAFGRAGWRTLAVAPAVENAWAEASAVYHYDAVYDNLNMGYHGPRFGWATMPDQFALAVLQRRELSRTRRPRIMAEVTLVSSHWPWRPLPRLLGWNDLGDGSGFASMVNGAASEGVLRDAERTTADYGESVAYSLDALTSFVQQLHDRDLVLIALGDHQPSAQVSGQGASRDVPATLITSDPAVAERATRWGWQPGMAPGTSPAWPMNELRDTLVTSFSTVRSAS